MDKLSFGTIVKTRVNRVALWLLENLAFPFPEEKLIWLNYECLLGVNILLDHTIRRPKTFGLHSFKDLWTKIFSSDDMLDNVAIGHSTVWKSVMKKFTFAEDGDSELWVMPPNFIIRVSYQNYRSSLYVFPYYITNTVNSMRFVGCGVQSMSSIDFTQLTNIFDQFTWMSVILTTLIIPVFMKMLHGNNELVNYVISVLKIFLEQGNPFKITILGNSQTRCVIGLLLFVGIMLTNAYKNTKIYNLVIPRKPILYKYFDELLHDQFQILARPSHILIFVFNPLELDVERLDVEVAGQETFILSEVASTLRASGNSSAIVEKVGTRSGLNNRVQKAAKMRPELLGIESTTCFHRARILLF